MALLFKSRSEHVRGHIEAAINTYAKYKVIDAYEPGDEPEAPCCYVGVPLLPETPILDEGGEAPSMTMEFPAYIVGVFRFKQDNARDAFAQGARMADNIEQAIDTYFAAVAQSDLVLTQYGYRFAIVNYQIVSHSNTPDLQTNTQANVILNIKIFTTQS